MKSAPDPLQDPRFDDILSRLRDQPAPEPAADFAARTLQRLREKPAAHTSILFRAARAAAAIALLLGAGLWFVRAPVPVAKAPAPIDILMAAQRADGGWSADAQHLRPRYDIGVSALAILALIHSDPSVLEGTRASAIQAGVAHLLSQQRPDGHFGDDFSGAAFSQYLAGMALQAAAKLPNADPDWRAAAALTQPHLPPSIQMASLNGRLAQPLAFPPRWAEAGGPVTVAALQLLNR